VLIALSFVAPRVALGAEAEIELHIDYPAVGSSIEVTPCGAFISGRARAVAPPEDIVLAIDVSHSTLEATGTDVDGDGVVGVPRLERAGQLFEERSTDPGDSVLAAEVAAARALLGRLDSRSARVALVTFSGEEAGKPAATTVLPLTNDRTRVLDKLLEIVNHAPHGGTDLAAGISRAAAELRAGVGGPARGGSVVLITDGYPTAPFGPKREADNVLATLRAGDDALKDGIAIHVIAVGPDALDRPLAAVELAERTGGSLMLIRNPPDLVAGMGDLSVVGITSVRLTNATTGNGARSWWLAVDGLWMGLLDIVPGPNTIEVVAAGVGTHARRTLELIHDPHAATAPFPPTLVRQRNALLESCLNGMLTAERERGQEVLRSLRIEMERERGLAEAKAATQRKELHIEIESGQQP
jgi:hypothetical protein